MWTGQGCSLSAHTVEFWPNVHRVVTRYPLTSHVHRFIRWCWALRLEILAQMFIMMSIIQAQDGSFGCQFNILEVVQAKFSYFTLIFLIRCQPGNFSKFRPMWSRFKPICYMLRLQKIGSPSVYVTWTFGQNSTVNLWAFRLRSECWEIQAKPEEAVIHAAY
jgi:hypothetical protein